jgi:hypothetical protein
MFLKRSVQQMLTVSRAIYGVLKQIPNLAEDDAYARAALREEHWYGELQAFRDQVHVRVAAINGSLLDADVSDSRALCRAIRSARRIFKNNLAWVEISRHGKGIILADHVCQQRKDYSRSSHILATSVVKCMELNPTIDTAMPHLIDTMVKSWL